MLVCERFFLRIIEGNTCRSLLGLLLSVTNKKSFSKYEAATVSFSPLSVPHSYCGISSPVSATQLLWHFASCQRHTATVAFCLLSVPHSYCGILSPVSATQLLWHFASCQRHTATVAFSFFSLQHSYSDIFRLINRRELQSNFPIIFYARDVVASVKTCQFYQFYIRTSPGSI